MKSRLAIASAALLAGLSLNGSVQAEPLGAGVNRLVNKVQANWKPDCKEPGVRDVRVVLKFTLTSDGLIGEGPEWIEPKADGVSVSVANSAKAAFRKGVPYTDLPQGLYNVPIEITFNAQKACAGA
ncbi:MAG: hypothetical protein QM667_02490 [Asticcacaulis sp.]